MKETFFIIAIWLQIYLGCFQLTDAQYLPNWKSLDARPCPTWYDDAKFGIFIHWGVYSVPSWAPVGTYAEWYWYQLSLGSGPTYDWHVKTYGKNFDYQDFAPMFQAELWDPDQWADLFVQSGAKYVVPTSKHHEGYTMWPSAQSWNWNSKDVGPQRDIIGELFTSLRARGLYASLYFSLFEWFNPIYRGPNPEEYVAEIMLPQMYDLVTNYAPDIIWTDGEWEHNSTFWNSTEFLAWLFNNAPNKESVVVNDRWGADTRGLHGGFFTAEYSTEIWLDHKWEENRGIDVHSYGLNRLTTAQNYSTAEELIALLVRTVAFGGNLLLDIGPSHDGEIPVVMQERLLSIGAWLQINGEAIYYTRKWTVQNESATLFYTQNAQLGAVYALTTEWPMSYNITLTAVVPTDNTIVTLLGYDGNPLTYSYANSEMVIILPPLSVETFPCNYAWVIKIVNVGAKGIDNEIFFRK